MQDEELVENSVKINILALPPIDSKEIILRIKKMIKEYLSRAYSGKKFILDININNKPLSIFYISRYAVRNRVIKEIYINNHFNINEENQREIRYITQKSDWNRYLSRETVITIQSFVEEKQSWFRNFRRKIWYYLDTANVCLNYSDSKEKSEV